MSEITQKTMTTWERLMILTIVGKMPANAETSLVRKVIKILDVVEFTEAEKATMPPGDRPLSEEELGRVWDVWINDPDALTVAKAAVKGHTGFQGADARRMLPLLEKLGID